jgi:hypothetical protein
VETSNKRTKENITTNVLRTQLVKSNPSTRTFNSCQVPVGRLGNESQPLIEPETSTAGSADLLWETNHQLESRMPEIGLFGSEGGAT